MQPTPGAYQSAARTDAKYNDNVHPMPTQPHSGLQAQQSPSNTTAPQNQQMYAAASGNMPYTYYPQYYAMNPNQYSSYQSAYAQPYVGKNVYPMYANAQMKAPSAGTNNGTSAYSAPSQAQHGLYQTSQQQGSSSYDDVASQPSEYKGYSAAQNYHQSMAQSKSAPSAQVDLSGSFKASQAYEKAYQANGGSSIYSQPQSQAAYQSYASQQYPNQVPQQQVPQQQAAQQPQPQQTQSSYMQAQQRSYWQS